MLKDVRNKFFSLDIRLPAHPAQPCRGDREKNASLAPGHAPAVGRLPNAHPSRAWRSSHASGILSGFPRRSAPTIEAARAERRDPSRRVRGLREPARRRTSRLGAVQKTRPDVPDGARWCGPRPHKAGGRAGLPALAAGEKLRKPRRRPAPPAQGREPSPRYARRFGRGGGSGHSTWGPKAADAARRTVDIPPGGAGRRAPLGSGTAQGAPAAPNGMAENRKAAWQTPPAAESGQRRRGGGDGAGVKRPGGGP